jgi:prepilin-type N-terminal cleavage/methylation domain-containing protein
MRNHIQSNSQLGFSLVEMLIALAIVAIVSTIAIPFFGGFLDNRDLKSAARDIAGDIFETKQKAISSGNYFRMVFNVAGNNYTIQQCDANNNDASCIVQITKSPTTFRNDIQLTNATFSGAVPTRITFQPRGTVDSGAGASNAGVVLTNGRTSSATVSVNLTGRTYVTWILH